MLSRVLLILLVLIFLMYEHHAWLAWVNVSLEIREDGLRYRTPGGRLTVPWDAMKPGTPGRDSRPRRLSLVFRDPAPVRRTGLVRLDRIAVGRVHPWFLADVLRYYVSYPGERRFIGTEEGYRRLLTAHGLPGPDAADPARPPPAAQAG
ncbi:hypothetical protein GCM10010123_10970 [Pilimelia anulata]|uniref:Uncharacterized protein n=1 Tax=Pilimelia anulata TaxID=53371 RepID=A0A8J3F849_9ACTN|nr:hypothetical protein [Pilimelia anulata]GGJ83138.1 hypothetical protein GCM10010123_10970 [Pilimelia anulata]